MIKTVGIVSLSSGIVGESFIRFESDIGIRRLKEYGLNVKFLPHALMGVDLFKAVSGVLVGKPMNETYAQEYRKLLIQVIDRPDLPVVFNLNVGHAMPRCIIPFGIEAVVDVENQIIRFTN